MSETLTPTDHSELALERMPPLWLSKPKAKGFIDAVSSSFQSIEDTLFQLLNEKGLNTAVGAQLDNLGLILNVKRLGRLDGEYRAALKAKATTLGNSGTTRDVKNIAKAITGGTECKVFPHYPACTYVFVNAPVSKKDYNNIQEGHIAGVRTRVIWSNDEYYVKPSITSVINRLYAECGEIECGGDLAEAGGYVDTLTSQVSLTGAGEASMQAGEPTALAGEFIINPIITWSTGMGFTSLVEGATGYEVVDNKGCLCALPSSSDPTLATGLIIDHDSNYIIDHDGDRMRFIE